MGRIRGRRGVSAYQAGIRGVSGGYQGGYQGYQETIRDDQCYKTVGHCFISTIYR